MASNNKYIQNGKFTEAFDSLVTQSIETWKVPGLSIAVIQDGEVCAKVCSAFFWIYLLKLSRVMVLQKIVKSQSRPRPFSIVRACQKLLRQQQYLCWWMMRKSILMSNGMLQYRVLLGMISSCQTRDIPSKLLWKTSCHIEVGYPSTLLLSCCVVQLC